MESKIRSILSERKGENVILKLVMERKIDDYSIDKIKEMILEE